MPIKQKGHRIEIGKKLGSLTANVKNALAYNLSIVGEKACNVAVNLPSPPASMRGKPHTPNYIDDTANLRNSIGYVVVVDGEVHRAGDFGKPGGSGEGKRQGDQYARSLAPQFPRGIVLIMVAGMRYASYVADKGYDVLDSAELMAERLVPQMLDRLGINYK